MKFEGTIEICRPEPLRTIELTLSVDDQSGLIEIGCPSGTHSHFVIPFASDALESVPQPLRSGVFLMPVGLKNGDRQSDEDCIRCSFRTHQMTGKFTLSHPKKEDAGDFGLLLDWCWKLIEDYGPEEISTILPVWPPEWDGSKIPESSEESCGETLSGTPVRRMAGRGDHIFVPMTENRKDLRFDLFYTRDQFETISRGFIPSVMEDKWFVFYNEEESRLYLVRSWTGYCLYMIDFAVGSENYPVFFSVSIRVETDPQRYSPHPEEEDALIIRFILTQGLLQIPYRLPVHSPADAAGYWSLFGRMMHDKWIFTPPENRDDPLFGF